MANFYSLGVKALKRETSECVSIALDVPSDLVTKFKFIQGQYVTFRLDLNGEEIRRSYSICSSPYGQELRVAVKQISNGKFSTYANTILKVGDKLDVMPPSGSFNTPLDSNQVKNYAAFASGSGITPIMSILRATLSKEAQSNFTLFYGNKTNQTIIFNNDLEDLKKEYPNRFKVYHVLSRVDDIEDKFKGRLSAEKCKAFHNDLIDLKKLDEVFLCGPEQMIFDVKDALINEGVKASSIHFELFTSSSQTTQADDFSEKSEVANSQIEVIVDGDSHHFELTENGDTILDAAIAVDADVPYACKGGVCCACKAKVMEGSVNMDVNYALDEDEVEEGYILTCQSHPTSDKVVIDFDEI